MPISPPDPLPGRPGGDRARPPSGPVRPPVVVPGGLPAAGRGNGALDRPVAPSRVLLTVAVSVVVTALFSSAHLVAIAGRAEYGPRRDALVAVAGGIHAVASAAGLDRPAAGLAAALGRAPRGAGTGVPPGPRGGQAAGPTPARAGVLATATRARTATAPAPPSGSPTAGAAVAPTRATAEPPRRRVAAERPLRVYVAGDSFAQPLGEEIAAMGARSAMVEVELDFRISTGLARPDYFDWPARLAEVAARPAAPEAVVVFMGANDDQNMITAEDALVEMTTREWRDEYRRRAAAAMDGFRAAGTPVFWVGLPIMREPHESAVARDINAALAAEAAARPWVRFVDIWAMFADASGRFAAFLPDGHGQMQEVRQRDGVHLQRVATREVAVRVYAALAATWDLTPPTATPTATSTATPSATPPATLTPTPSDPVTPPPAAPRDIENGGGPKSSAVLSSVPSI